MIEPGTIVLGKYRVERILGIGGMGKVALVHHLQLDEPMAMKCLLPAVVAQPDVVQRFLREARAAVKLKGEHICRIFDVGTLADGAPYMVMEYLPGLNLGEFLQRYGVQPTAVIVDIALQACEALAEAHALGIVHRDVKPSNFVLTQRNNGTPLVKLLDFGISKGLGSNELELTSAQAMLGTPAYMSPEQLRSSKAVDARTDIWALGAILYELASGRRPFSGETFSALCLQVAMEPVPQMPLSVLPAFAQVVMRCLQKDLDARFQTVTELAHALMPLHQGPGLRLVHAGGRSTSVLDMPIASLTGPVYPDVRFENARAVSTTLTSGTGHIPVAPARSGRIWLLAALIAVLAGITAAVVLVSSNTAIPAGEQARGGPHRAANVVGVDAALADAGLVPVPADAAGDELQIEFETIEPVVEPEPSEPEASEPEPSERDKRERASKAGRDAPNKSTSDGSRGKPKRLESSDTLLWK